MSEASFWLAYDGEALKAGEMEVSDLAPALLAVGQMLKAAGKIAHGADTQVSVKVQATRAGSFEILFKLLVEGAAQGWSLWKSDDVQAAASLLGVLGVSAGTGALQIVKLLKGKRPSIRSSEKPGQVILKTEDVELEVPEDAARIALDPGVRAAMEKAIADPLDAVGIDTVAFSDREIKEGLAEVITAPQAEYYRAPTLSAEDEFTSRYEKPFSISSLSFEAGKKWRLSDGHGRSKQIIISDEGFLARVERSDVRFAKGDVLVCEVVERSRRTSGGFKAEYEITKVLEHRPAPPPEEGFDFSGGGDRSPSEF